MRERGCRGVAWSADPPPKAAAVDDVAVVRRHDAGRAQLSAVLLSLALAAAAGRSNLFVHQQASSSALVSAFGTTRILAAGPVTTRRRSRLATRPLSGTAGTGRDDDKDEDGSLEAARSRWRRRDLFGQSLVDETLEELKSRRVSGSAAAVMDDDRPSSPATTATSTATTSKEERARQRRDLHHLNVPSFSSVLAKNGLPPALLRTPPKILQVNIGLYCNQACSHCHVESSPLRIDETMSGDVVERCLQLLFLNPQLTTLDITGGAPELNQNFRMLVAMARQLRPDVEIIDRCNLTVLLEPGQEDLVDFLKQHRVRIVASLPCYSSDNVDKQRGRGVFDRSVAALLALNAAGYGTDPDLPLDLVYNPVGPFLPPDQSKLQDQYKAELRRNFGILFDSLFTTTNMPIKRFADALHRQQQLQSYLELLVENFNPGAVEKVMCTDTISVDYQGNLYDCDFNQQLGIPIVGEEGNQALTVFDVGDVEQELGNISIRTDRHCFGCTAGMGSSCQGATTTTDVSP